MDVDSILVNLQERDKWRSRLDQLQNALRELRDRKSRVEKRLRRIKADLSKIGDYSDAVLAHSTSVASSRITHASADTHLTAR